MNSASIWSPAQRLETQRRSAASASNRHSIFHIRRFTAPNQRHRQAVRKAAHREEQRNAAQLHSTLRQAPWSVPLSDPWSALLLAWFASSGQSILAARCLVEAVLQCYFNGATYADVQTGLKLAILSASSQASSPPPQPPSPSPSTSSTSFPSSPSPPSPPATTSEAAAASPFAEIQAQLRDQQTAAGMGPGSQQPRRPGAGEVTASPGAGSEPTAGGVAGGAVAGGVERGGGGVGQQGGAPKTSGWDPLGSLQSWDGDDDEAGGWGTGGGEGGVQLLLNEQEEGVLLSWVALVMLAAQVGQLGQLGKGYLQGMQGFVVQALGMYRSGYSLERLTALQAAVSQGAPPGGVQAMMQQYTRIVVLTLEILAALGLAPSAPASLTSPTATPGGQAGGREGEGTSSMVPGPQPEPGLELEGGQGGQGGQQKQEEGGGVSRLPADFRPTGYTSTFVEGPLACQLATQSMDYEPVTPARSHALRLLLAFMGALRGSGYSLHKFVEAAALAYGQGWSASELFEQLEDRDFVQSGGLLVVVAAADEYTPSSSGPDPGAAGSEDRAEPSASSAAPAANKQLFSNWLSTCYMALAQLGATFPGAAQLVGWAWAGLGEASEAAGLDAFVSGALRRCIEQEREQSASIGGGGGIVGGEAAEPFIDSDGQRLAPQMSLEADTFLASLQANPGAAEQMEGARAVAAQEYLSQGRLRGKPAPESLVVVRDESWAESSSALQVLSMQQELVRRAFAMAQRARAMQQQEL
ncbi:hypothetical protein QJQ45_030319 [Haematococcus lacustris]|nr:hypothetical protein QJQ45_030319 [Haematococcus lacustris]